MRALVQRVASARVRVEDAVVADIGHGLCVLLGIAAGDTVADADRLARRVANLRIFESEAGRLDRSLLDIGGEALVVSQFTLIADTAKGNRPSFSSAARPESAEPVYRAFCAALAREGVARVDTGRFGATMLVEIANDGPVTIVIDT
jgi:D-tyrosyl-tRNA(Tyr) deacylase